MATCLEVISRANLKLGRLALAATLGNNSANNGLDVLKSFYLGLVNSGNLGRARTIYATGGYTAQEGDRIFKSAALTVTIPGNYEITYIEETGYTVTPGSGASDDTRAPKDGAFVVVTDGTTTATSVYDAYIGAWKIIETLVLADPAPFSRDKEALASALAFELADDEEQQPGPATLNARARFFRSVSLHLGSPETSVSHEYF